MVPDVSIYKGSNENFETSEIKRSQMLIRRINPGFNRYEMLDLVPVSPRTIEHDTVAVAKPVIKRQIKLGKGRSIMQVSTVRIFMAAVRE